MPQRRAFVRVLRIGVVAALMVIATLLCGEVAIRMVTPPTPPGMFVADADLGFRLAAHFRGEERTANAAIPLAFNSWGLRDREYGARPQGGLRIYVLGDSFVFGHQVQIEDTFSKVLERALQLRLPTARVEVVNGGVPRYGTLQEAGLFAKTAELVRPDVVLLAVFVGNDVLDNLEFARAHADGKGRHGTNLLDRLRVRSQLYMWVRRRRHAADQRQRVLEGRAMESHAVAPSAEMERGLALTEAAIAKLAAAVHERGARFAVLLIPSAAQVYPALWQEVIGRHHLQTAAYDNREPNVRLQSFAQRHGIPLLDLLSVLQAHQAERLYFTLHWNLRGHAVAGEAAAAFLLDSGVLAVPATAAAAVGQ